MSITKLYQMGKVNTRHFFTVSGMYQNGKDRHDSSMTTDEIRRENMRWLAQKCGGPKKLADLLDVAEARISHLIGKNPTKNVGTQTARKLEQIFDKPTGWLDTPNAWAAEDEELAAVVRVEDITRLISLFGQASDEQRQQILKAAELAVKLPRS
jgi:plasmid maintenance system antidote protein VapI